jgi:hypothetical protein
MKVLNEILASQNLKTIFTLFTPLLEKEYSFLLKEIKGFLHGHPELIQLLSKKTQLSAEEVEERLDHYVTVLAISVIGGWHLGKRINRLEGFRGALLGIGAGTTFLVGEYLYERLIQEGELESFLQPMREKLSELRA